MAQQLSPPEPRRGEEGDHKICSVIFREAKDLANSNTYLTGFASCGRSGSLKGVGGFSGSFRDFHIIHMGRFILSTGISNISKSKIHAIVGPSVLTAMDCAPISRCSPLKLPGSL
jgi:hypothetical protein